MFYAHYVLSKKGPLARIWLAAHWDKKLTRNHVFDTNITSSVEAILQPQVKLALRTSGHLLLGVVRIYSRQAKYLLADCNEAFVKIKMAFRPGVESSAHEMGNNEDVLAAITLQENMRDFESTLADLNDINEQQHIAMNQSRVEDITMREEFGEVNLGRPDDDFGDSTFAADVRDYEQEEEHEVAVVAGLDNEDVEMVNLVTAAAEDGFGAQMPPSVTMQHEDDFGDTHDADDYDSGDHFDSMPFSPGEGPASVLPETVPTPRPEGSVTGEAGVAAIPETSLFRDTTMGTMVQDSFSGVDSGLLDSTADSRTVVGESSVINQLDTITTGALPTVPEEESRTTQNSSTPEPPQPTVAPEPLEATATVVPGSAGTTVRIRVPKQQQQPPQAKPPPPTAVTDFVLPPLRGDTRQENRRGPKRKRRLIIDEHKSIPSDVMKLQMQDTSEIMTRLDLAPPTRKLMFWKESGTAEMLLSNPGRSIPSRILQKLFYRNMKTRPLPTDAPGGLPIIAGEELENQNEENDDILNTGRHGTILEEEEDDEFIDRFSRPPTRPPTAPGTPFSGANGADDHDATLIGDPATPGPPMGGGAYSEYSVAYDAGAPYTPLPPPVTESTEAPIGCGEGQTNIAEAKDQQTIPPPGTPIVDNSVLTNLSSSFYEDVERARFTSSNANETLRDEDIENASGGSIIKEVRDNSIHTNTSSRFTEDLENIRASSNITDMLHDGSQFLADNSLNGPNNDMNIIDSVRQQHNVQLQSAIEALDNRMESVDNEYRQEMTAEGLEKRSEVMSSVLKKALAHNKELSFQDLTVSNNKKQAASKFYTLLLLGRSKVIKLRQENPFSDIIITDFCRGGITTSSNHDTTSDSPLDETQSDGSHIHNYSLSGLPQPPPHASTPMTHATHSPYTPMEIA